MGLLDWLKGGTPPASDPKAQWIRQQLDERQDAAALVDACAALAGQSSMIFGMVMADFAGRKQLLADTLARLQRMIPTLPDEQCDHVFRVVENAKLRVDVADRRAQLEATRRRAFDTATAAIREALERSDIDKLLAACLALRNRQRTVLGVDVPFDETARNELYERGLERLRTLLPTLSDDAFFEASTAIRRARLPIDIAERTASIAAQRRSEREAELAAGDEPRNRELERAIEETGDDQAFVVLADWLQTQNHPRGELIALQLRAESEPALQQRVDAHLATHAAALLGPLAPYQHMRDGTQRPAFTWRRGFIDHARLSYDDNAADPSDSNSDATVAELLHMLLWHPSGRYLAGLGIGLNEAYDRGLADVIAMLVQVRARTLRTLELGDFTRDQCEVSWYEIGDLAPLWAAVPTLRRLIVHGGSFTLGAIELPLVEHVEILTGGLSGESARAIANARWPSLRFLDVWYGDVNYGGEATVDDVRPLLARTDLPDLVHLGLKNAAFTDDICDVLARTAFGAQLRELDLSMGTMTDAGAKALVAARRAFPNLATLDVSDNFLSEAAVAALVAAYPSVTAADQKVDDEDDRYPSVGE